MFRREAFDNEPGCVAWAVVPPGSLPEENALVKRKLL